MEFRTPAELTARLDHLRSAPKDEGTLALLVRRPAVGEREILDAGELSTDVGLVGDCWLTRGSSSRSGGAAHPDKQLNVMPYRMVSFLADTPEEQALAGDQLYLDLDLSVDNLPTGSRIAIGDAVIEVTEPPHRGCDKFMARFGRDAMAFVNNREGRALRLRGLNAKVVTPGTVTSGSTARVVHRPLA